MVPGARHVREGGSARHETDRKCSHSHLNSLDRVARGPSPFMVSIRTSRRMGSIHHPKRVQPQWPPRASPDRSSLTRGPDLIIEVHTLAVPPTAHRPDPCVPQEEQLAVFANAAAHIQPADCFGRGRSGFLLDPKDGIETS